MCLATLKANQTKNIVFVGNNVRARALAASLTEKNVLFAFATSAGHRERDRVESIDLKRFVLPCQSSGCSEAGISGDKVCPQEIRIFSGYRVFLGE